MTTRNDIKNWLGDIPATPEQIERLTEAAQQIDTQFPGPDFREEHMAAMEAAAKPIFHQTMLEFLTYHRPAPAWALEGRDWEIVDNDAAREPSSEMFTLETESDGFPMTAQVDVHSSERWGEASLVPAVRIELLGTEPRFTANEARMIAQALLVNADLLDQINSQG